MAERVIRSLKSECLSHLMLFSKKQLELAVQEYVQFYNTQRPHQGWAMKSRLRQKSGMAKSYAKKGLAACLSRTNV
jgi:transposase InsO family protein